MFVRHFYIPIVSDTVVAVKCESISVTEFLKIRKFCLLRNNF
jgi:hypothetical protein